MKSGHRILLCCFVARFCCAVVECHGDLLDADGNTLKEGNLSEDKPEKDVVKAINIDEYLLLTSNQGNILNARGDEDAIKKKCKEICGFKEEVLEEGEVECKSDLNHIECKCKGGNKMEFDYDAQICKTCDCGVGAKACRFENGAVNCTCKYKFAQKEDKCEKCDCGRLFKGCSFQGNNKTCDCYPTFAQKEDQCIDCACGPFAQGCSFQGDNKTCDCPPKFLQKGDTCEDCDCGVDIIDCSFDGHTKVCNCNWNYAQKEDRCVECYCGWKTEIESCHFDNDEKICKCKEGVLLIDGMCTTLADECSLRCGREEGVTCERKGNQTLCLCEEGKIFDSLFKICKTDNCYEKCGVISGKVHGDVKCKEDPLGKVSCICLHDYQMFDPDLRKCRNLLDICIDMCGLDTDVICEFKEKGILCQCSEGKYFNSLNKECREEDQKQPGVSKSEIAAIAATLSVGIVLLAAGAFYHFIYKRKSQFNRHVPDLSMSSGNVFQQAGCVNMGFTEGTKVSL